MGDRGIGDCRAGAYHVVAALGDFSRERPFHLSHYAIADPSIYLQAGPDTDL